MTERARRRAFLGAAALVGVALVVPVLNPTRSRDGSTVAVRESAVVLAAVPDSSGATGRNFAGTRATHNTPASARRRALAFLRAFLRYQRGDIGTRAGAALARAASAELTRYLVATPARAGGARPPAKLVSLRLYPRGGGEAKASALLRYGGSRSLFEFRLERGRGGWRVAELYR